MAKKRTTKKRISKKTVSTKQIAPNARAGLIFAGLISLILGWILWDGILSLEKVLAILLFIAGALKVLWGIFSR
ncbi:hypothetical protein K8R33_04690 [archaeon]|nr:hypothetical protein [archaeon]